MLFAMHIPDGFLALPAAVVCAIVAALALTLAVRCLARQQGERFVPLLGVTAAGLFAGQMVNFPLLGLQTSGHLMGGVLAAVILGPWGAMVAIASVLLVQCFLFGDGGVTALGANLLNMGVIGGMLGYAVYSTLRRAIGGNFGTVAAAVLASWIIIPVSALAFSVEMAVGGGIEFMPLVTLMVFYHVWIGLGEAVLTGLVTQWLVRVRPDLIYQPNAAEGRLARAGRVVAAGLAVAVAVAVFLAPWASSFEDGLERVAIRLGFDDRATSAAWSPFPDYEWPWVTRAMAAENGTPTKVEQEVEPTAGADQAEHSVEVGWLPAAGMTTSLLGLIGTLATCVVAWAIGRGACQAARMGRANASG